MEIIRAFANRDADVSVLETLRQYPQTLYISLWAVPMPICSLEAISLNIINPIPERCYTIRQPISADYGCILAASIEVIAVLKLVCVNCIYAHAYNLKI